MKKAWPMIVCAIAASSLFIRSGSAQVAITHVSAIQPADGSVLKDVTIVIRGDRIVSVGHRPVIPAGTTVIDAHGKYVIPGLWDMHVHLGSVGEARKNVPIAVRQGITGLRDMGTPLEEALSIRTQLRRELGPELYVSGPIVNGPLPFRNPLIESVATPAEAKAAAVRLIAAGVDFIKVHDVLGAPEYDAIAAVCRARRFPFAGHVPVSITAEHAATSGQRSIEHLGGRFYGVMLSCSRDETDLEGRVRALLATVAAEVREGKEPDDSELFKAAFTQPLVETFDAAKATRLLQSFRDHQTWHCPTLVSLPLRQAIEHGNMEPADQKWAGSLFSLMQNIVVRIATRNGTLLAGTDAPLSDPQLHEELRLLVAAGLSPLDAVRTATINPARYFHRTKDFGSIKRGQIANLVILDANPLDDITNTRRIWKVILRGRAVTP